VYTFVSLNIRAYVDQSSPCDLRNFAVTSLRIPFYTIRSDPAQSKDRFSHFASLTTARKLVSGCSRRLTEAISDNRIVRRLNHCRYADRWKAIVDQFELENTQQRRPYRLDLHVGERLADATMATGAERHVAELLFVARSLRIKKPAPHPRHRHVMSRCDTSRR
jgi:hypothetical protein